MAWMVDIPTKEMIGDDNGSWLHVFTAKSKEEAIAWIRRHIGQCDEEGQINLLTNCPDWEQEESPADARSSEVEE